MVNFLNKNSNSDSPTKHFATPLGVMHHRLGTCGVESVSPTNPRTNRLWSPPLQANHISSCYTVLSTYFLFTLDTLLVK